jgi:PucR family transcriptional regulator, purine catabolism regulatory protein
MNGFSLTVADVLTKKLFSSAKLLAGAQGQINVIKWCISSKIWMLPNC